MRWAAVGGRCASHAPIGPHSAVTPAWASCARRRVGIRGGLRCGRRWRRAVGRAHRRVIAPLGLHRALAEAVDIAMPISDYYRHPACDGDGDYLRDLVQSCREGCVSLPRYEAVRPALRYHATVTATVQCLNHNTRRGERDQALRAWAHNEYHCDGDLRWWEMTAAASSSLAIHVLLALAAKPEHGDTAAVLAVFTPWVCAVNTLLVVLW